MNFEEVYTQIFSSVENYCHKKIQQTEVKHSWLIEFVKENNFKSVVDIGSGTGAMLSYFIDKDVELLATDLNNFLLYDIPFKQINLMDSLSLDKVYDLVICCDVIEHLPLPNSIEVLDKIKPFGKKFLLAIANHSDIINGIELHLTRENKNFWDQEVSKRFNILESGIFYSDKLYMYVAEQK